MPLPSKPLSVVAAVVKRSAGMEDRVHELLGTAFLVADKLLMSVNHAFGVIPTADQEVAVVAYDEDGPVAHLAEVIYQDPRRDIAVARVAAWPESQPLSLTATDNLTINNDVLTLEFSPTRGGVQLADGRIAMVCSWNFHKGHIIRDFISDRNETACLELSYPAFKGASGAPVIEERSGDVLGMIFGNIGMRLMPAEMERVERVDGSSEEVIRYFFPSAQAIRASHLRRALADVMGTYGVHGQIQ
jgi:Trypsin-like peptidase domain